MTNVILSMTARRRDAIFDSYLSKLDSAEWRED